MSDQAPTRPRLPYAPPRLVVYGTVRDLTLRNGGTAGMNDGGGGNDKTSF
ncbi:MAG TPA: lasso RiPP family leader peptide-containing protein [Longimicrobium sp.]|nr:lasso RiPP family leader peptide-containing protein [Longimicrobium sp.]